METRRVSRPPQHWRETGGMRSTEGWARAQKSWLQTSYHLPHLTTPTCSLFLPGFPTPPSLLVHRM